LNEMTSLSFLRQVAGTAYNGGRLVGANLADISRELLLLRPALRRPIFVVGSGHSGTTLMRVLIGELPNVHGIEVESGLFRSPPGDTRTRAKSALQRRPYRQATLWDKEAKNNHSKRWCEKTPWHVLRIDMALRLFPRAKVIIMVRDGRDVVNSMMKRGRALDESCDLWRRAIDAGRPYHHNERCHVVHYEDLISDPEGTLRRVCGFIGETFDHRILSFHERTQTHNRQRGVVVGAQEEHLEVRNAQINQPLFDGRGRWLDDLTESQRGSLEIAIGDLLEELNYGDAT